MSDVRAAVGFFKLRYGPKATDLAESHSPMMLHGELRDSFGLLIIRQMRPAGIEGFLVNTAQLPFL